MAELMGYTQFKIEADPTPIGTDYYLVMSVHGTEMRCYLDPEEIPMIVRSLNKIYDEYKKG